MTTNAVRDRLIQLACSQNCASADSNGLKLLEQARELLAEQPELPKSCLYAAAAVGDLESVRKFLEAEPDLVTRRGGVWDWPPLLYVCFSRFLRDHQSPVGIQKLLHVASYLLDQGADANSFFMLGEERETALYAACGVCNNADLVRMLLQHGANVNDEDATYHVAEFDEHDCIRVLFEHGLDADRSATVLLRKLDFDDFAGVKLILDLGCDVNHMGYWGKSPLHQAIMRRRDLRFIKLLLQRGADVNAVRSDGATPWYLASLQGDTNLMELLESNGANDSLTPDMQFLSFCSLGNGAAAREMLYERPNLIEELDPEQRCLITSLGIWGNRIGIETMLDVGFEIDCRDQQGFTALHWAAWHGHLDCVELLLSRNAPVDATNNYGGTVISSTVWGYANSNGDDRNCRQVLELLVKNGADPESVSPWPSGHAESDQIISDLRAGKN